MTPDCRLSIAAVGLGANPADACEALFVGREAILADRLSQRRRKSADELSSAQTDKERAVKLGPPESFGQFLAMASGARPGRGCGESCPSALSLQRADTMYVCDLNRR